MPVYKVEGQIDVRYALKKGAVFGTAVAAGAGDGILGTGEGFTLKQGLNPANETGSQFETEVDKGNRVPAWSHKDYLRYDGLMLFLSLAMGTAGAPTQQAATTAYKHVLKIAANRYGLFATYVKNYLANIFEDPSLKITGFKISGPDSEGRMNIEFKGLPFDKLQGSATNTIATFTNVTIPYTGNRVLFKQLAFRLNAQSAAALASPADVLKVASMEFDYDWGTKAEFTSEFGDRHDQPTDEGKPTATLKLNFPRYDDAAKARLDSFDAGTLFKGDIVATGALIATTYYRKMTLRFPQLAIERPEQGFNTGTIPQSVTFRCQKAAAAPLGMVIADIGYDLVNPFDMEFINTQTTDPLA